MLTLIPICMIPSLNDVNCVVAAAADADDDSRAASRHAHFFVNYFIMPEIYLNLETLL